MAIGTATRLSAPRIDARALSALAAGGLLAVVGFAVFIEWRAAPFRAEAARLLDLELAAESKAFCEKYGVQDGTIRQRCASDLQLIRDKQSERINQDAGFGL
ncbi:MAG: hypothetical protein QOD94_2730 [Alphaproteobacteria bacterium]|jgi:hypothetical protein|nr:hypothetical protein [Alphaproteobacteria bacterium]